MDGKISLIYQSVLGRTVSPSTLLHEGHRTIVPTELKIVKLPPAKSHKPLGGAAGMTITPSFGELPASMERHWLASPVGGPQRDSA